MRPLLLASAALLIAAAPPATKSPEQIAQAALANAPVFDGHNDVPEQLRDRRKNLIDGFDFNDTTNTADPANKKAAMMTDLKRAAGGAGNAGADRSDQAAGGEISEFDAAVHGFGLRHFRLEGA